MNRLIVVEPHPDDAFLSLDWTMRTIYKEWEKIIITVYAEERRAKEAQAYANTLPNGKSIALGLTESKMDSSGPIGVVPELRTLLEGLGEWETIAFPLGLQHPDHKRVAATRVPGCLRYLDSPYLSKQKLTEELVKKLAGMVHVSMVFPPKTKWHHHKVFKSQSKFFHFNAHLFDSKIPEVLVQSAE